MMTYTTIDRDFDIALRGIAPSPGAARLRPHPRPTGAILASLTLGLLLLGGAGCPAPATTSARPEDALTAYAEAVLAGKVDRAYELMSEAYRKRYDKKEFARMLREHPADVQASMKQLQAKATEVQVEARVELAEADSLKLVVENGAWKIATDPTDFYSQRTPADALRSFVRALERRRYDIVLRFVPAKWAETMTVEKLRQEWEGQKKDEVGSLIKNLKANLNAPIHVAGDTANMPYGEKFEVRFVREDGIWKIEDPD